MYANFRNRLGIFSSIQNRKTQSQMAHVTHAAQLRSDSYELTSAPPQCDAVWPVLPLV